MNVLLIEVNSGLGRWAEFISIQSFPWDGVNDMHVKIVGAYPNLASARLAAKNLGLEEGHNALADRNLR